MVRIHNGDTSGQGYRKEGPGGSAEAHRSGTVHAAVGHVGYALDYTGLHAERAAVDALDMGNPQPQPEIAPQRSHSAARLMGALLDLGDTLGGNK